MKDSTVKWIRVIAALVLAAQLVWTIVQFGRGRRLVSWGPVGTAALVASVMVYALAIWSLVRWDARRRWLLWLILIAALGITARFHRQPLLSPRRDLEPDQVTAIAYLREITAAQEQFRLRTGVYTDHIDSLARWIPASQGNRATLRSTREGWSGEVTSGNERCRLWVRDLALRPSPNSVEGIPSCDGTMNQMPWQLTSWSRERGCSAAPAPAKPTQVAATGRWEQHRGSPERAGRVPGDGAFRWAVEVCGEIRSQVSIAGNQVLVGTHGNGELVSLRLSDGALQYRLRAPNWIHHEPAVSADLVLVGFGNSEIAPGMSGSPPSGVAAYDRRTGVERWRRYEPAHVMTTPVVWHDSLVIAVTGHSEAIAWRLADGQEMWRSRLAGGAVMGNALLLDTTVLVGVGRRTLCAIEVSAGRNRFCREVGSTGNGLNVASASGTGDTVLVVYNRGLLSTDGARVVLRERRWKLILSRLLGDRAMFEEQSPPPAGEQMLVALRASDGAELWRLALGVGRVRPVGHNAGTPVLDSGVAYVVSPFRDNVTAAHIATGRKLWSADVRPSRGTPLVLDAVVIVATADSALVVLDKRTGATVCTQRLPAVSDRAGPTAAGSTGVLTLRSGMVMARPIEDWKRCRA